MDVRCEKCGTEYELDEARLKPSGVTVKCTSCDHVFRVRRHPITSVGVGLDEPPSGTKRPDTVPEDISLEGRIEPDLDDPPRGVPGTDTIPITPLDADDSSIPRAIRLTPSSARAHARRGRERNWLVRLPSGDIETCRELATLHQWIVSGKVSRTSGISRTGKTWKRLGDIKELSAFFDAAADMRRARRADPDQHEHGADLDAPPAGSPEPIPDSFSASGPVSAEPSGPVSASAPQPARGDSTPAGTGAVGGSEPAPTPEVKRTLIGVPTAPVRARAASYQRALTGDSAAADPEAPGAETPPEPAPGAPRAPLSLPDLSEHDEGDTTVQAEPVSMPDADPDRAPAAGASARTPEVAATWKPSMQLRGEPAAHPHAQSSRGTADASTGSGAATSGPARPVAAGAPASAAEADGSARDDEDTRVDMPGGRLESEADIHIEHGPDDRLESEADIHIEHGPDDRLESEADTRIEHGPAVRLESEADIHIEYGSGAMPENADENVNDSARDPEDGAGSQDILANEDGDASGDSAGELDESASSGPRLGSRTGMARIAALDERQGPSAGLARGVAADDVAFAGSRIRPLPDDAGEPDDLPEDELVDAPSRAGRWIVLVALALMATSAAVVYTLVFRPSEEHMDIVVGEIDASPEELALADPEAELDPEQIAAGTRARLGADTRAGLEALSAQLANVDERHDPVLAARARVHTALAQQLTDRAGLLDDEDERAALRRQAEELVLEALTLAQRALQANRDDAAALVAMADVQRLQGRSAQQVESYLARALEREREHFDARLVRAMTHARSKRRHDDARALLEELAAEARGSGDVRPAYRLALMDHAEGRDEDARRRAREVLAVQPAHEGALALIERSDSRPVVDTSDPMPPEDHGPGPEEDQRDEQERAQENASSDERSKDPGDDTEETRDEDSYEGLVAEARREARGGKCGEAIELYERALDMNPSGVDALTGMGRCHAELDEFASAYGKFQAALGVSSGNAGAMWGMAETYRKQGLKAQALEWYRKYVEAHPNGGRANAARRRIDELGGAQDAPAEEADAPAKEPDTPAKEPDAPAKGTTAPGEGSTAPTEPATGAGQGTEETGAGGEEPERASGAGSSADDESDGEPGGTSGP